MRLRHILAASALSALSAGLVGPPAGAAATIDDATAVRDGDRVTVSGTASFTPAAETSVGGSVTKGAVATTPVAEPAGLVLKDARIAPLADGAGLRFTWEVTDLPDQVPPEGVRYNWSFTAGGRQFQLQAKRTNMVNATTTEDPVGHALQAQKNSGFFQMRGACETAYRGTPISGCYHLAFLNGSFDSVKNLVTMDVPYNTRDSIGRLVAPEFTPGAVLVPLLTANTSIVAGAQAFASTSDTGSSINDWRNYYVGDQVRLAVGPADADPAELTFDTAATLTGNSFTGTITAAEDEVVHVAACQATTCTYAVAG